MDKGDQQSGGEPKNPMTKEDAARIQSSNAKQHGGEVHKGSFPARAQAAAAKHENKSKEGGIEQSGGELKSTRYEELNCTGPKRNKDTSSLEEICAHCSVYRGFDNEIGKSVTNDNHYSVGCVMQVLNVTQL